MPTARESGARLFRREFDLEGPTTGSTPAMKLCNLILAEGLSNGARAIRLRPAGDAAGGVDYEIAGAWRPVMRIPIPAFGLLVNRLKVMAALDISRQPVQHGDVHVRFKDRVHVLRLDIELEGAHENALLTVTDASAT